jgi:hypothetical protein
LATLPITTATPKRTFSTLKRLKIYLRNATGDDRLTGLALLSVHRNIIVGPEEVINHFSNEKIRNITFFYFKTIAQLYFCLEYIPFDEQVFNITFIAFILNFCFFVRLS